MSIRGVPWLDRLWVLLTRAGQAYSTERSEDDDWEGADLEDGAEDVARDEDGEPDEPESVVPECDETG